MTSLLDWALAVLNTADPVHKVAATRKMAEEWQRSAVPRGDVPGAPDRPARPERPELLLPKYMPKRTYAGQAGRTALVHALAHIEFNAIDLACDIMCRRWDVDLPDAFYDDWVQVALDEADHFDALNAVLRQWGACYGDLPAHDELWLAAERTAHDLLARLAVVPMTLEARGLDTTPNGIDKLRLHGHDGVADALEIIYRDEIRHVAAGMRWFRHVTAQRGIDPLPHYRRQLELYFPGQQKPPFNHAARAEAGMTPEWYDTTALIVDP